MRRLTVLFAFLAVLAVPVLASAATITLTDYTSGDFANNAAGGGGPFLATANGGPLGNTSFLTFCIEFNEEFYYGGTYNYVLNSGAVNGGIAGQSPSGSNYDPLSDATKWLYYQAVSGLYTSWYQTLPGLSLDANVGANFQYAIWYLEDEYAAGQTVPAAGLAIANYALGLGNLSTPGYNVYAMNLTDDAGGLHQDQLAFEPVPEPASLVLLGTGLLLASRRFVKKSTRPD